MQGLRNAKSIDRESDNKKTISAQKVSKGEQLKQLRERQK